MPGAKGPRGDPGPAGPPGPGGQNTVSISTLSLKCLENLLDIC